MQGFFSATELASAAPAGCHSCGLFYTCKSPKMAPSGKGEKRIMIVAEAPGEDEDMRGQQLIGKAGQKLRETLRKFDVDLDRDCRKLNSVNCRPPKNRPPTPAEMTACRPMVMREADEFGPHLVILLGQSAITSWMGHRYRDEGGSPALSRIRGHVFPDREFNCWVLPTFHPSYILRTAHDPVTDLTWRKDLARGMSFLTVPEPSLPDPVSFIRTTLDPAKTYTFLCRILERKTAIAVDYETSGLKPYREGHFIRSIAVAVTPELSVSFPWYPELSQHKRLNDLWTQILTDPEIEKAVYGDFEWIWSRVMFGVEPQNMVDVRLRVHLEDCRRGYTPLKLQGMLRYGIIGYEDEVGRFLKAPRDSGEGENAFNRILQAPVGELLHYNAEDALITIWLRDHYRKLERNQQ